MNHKLASYMKQGLHLLLMSRSISETSADDILAALAEIEHNQEEPMVARILHETERAFCLDILYKHVWLSKRMIQVLEKHDDVIVFMLRVTELAELKEIIP